jgi:hypothetical protein
MFFARVGPGRWDSSTNRSVTAGGGHDDDVANRTIENWT